MKHKHTHPHNRVIVVAYRCACASTFPSNDLNKQFPLSLSISGYKNSIFFKWIGKKPAAFIFHPQRSPHGICVGNPFWICMQLGRLYIVRLLVCIDIETHHETSFVSTISSNVFKLFIWAFIQRENIIA